MRWRPVDVIVASLAFVLLMHSVASIAARFYPGDFSVERAEIVANVVMAIISIVSLYVGASLKGGG